MARNDVLHTFKDSNLLYVSTWGGGLSVINTQGTLDPSDDTLVTRYHTGSTPALADNYVRHTFKDGNLLYVSTDGGLSVINTQGTESPSDDTLVTRYHTVSTPALAGNGIVHTFKDDNLLYVSTEGGGLSVVDLSGQYTPNTSYTSQTLTISTTQSAQLALDNTVSSGQAVTASYRTGTTSAAFRDEFDTLDSYLGDFYEWGAEFQSVVAADGLLTFSNPTANWGAYTWFDTGFGDDYFPAGTVVQARVRMNTDDTSFVDWMFLDEWEGANVEYTTTNEWLILSLIADQPFSRVGFEPWLQTGTWQPEDNWQIDWLQITTPDSLGHWNDWQPCATNPCTLDQDYLAGESWFQYRLDLSTDNRSTTPVVHSVSVLGDYTPTGTYTSDTRTLPRTQELITFNADLDVPTGTSINFEYSTDGTTWQAIAPGGTFAPGTLTDQLIWRAELLSTNPNHTPTITSVTITAGNPKNATTATSVTARVASLEAQGKLTEAEAIRQRYPHLFTLDGQPITGAVQLEIIKKAEEVVGLLERLIEMKREEE